MGNDLGRVAISRIGCAYGAEVAGAYDLEGCFDFWGNIYMRDESLAPGAVAVFVVPEPRDVSEEQGCIMIDIPQSPVLADKLQSPVSC